MAVPTDVNSPLNAPSHTGEHQRVSDAIALLNPTWIALPFQNGWTNYGAGFELGAYCKINNVVYLTGMTVSGTALTMFTLPAGYRPARNHIVIVMSGAASGYCRADMMLDGRFILTATTPTAGSLWLSVSSVSFPIAALP
jgi:hypothetical protein